MFQLSQNLLIIIIIFLIILGLNVSNDGINSLTMEERGPVVGVQLESSDVNVFFLGEPYNLNKEKTLNLKDYFIKHFYILTTSVRDHLFHIKIIFKALLY